MLLFSGFSLVLIAFVKQQEKYIPDGEYLVNEQNISYT